MESSKNIPHEIGGIQNDALRFGLQGVKSDLVRSHPVESLYETVDSLLDKDSSPRTLLTEAARSTL